jgi:hypothetical protein
MSGPTLDRLRIAVAGGEGGTGKTMVAVNPARVLVACHLLRSKTPYSPRAQGELEVGTGSPGEKGSPKTCPKARQGVSR